MNLKNMDIVYFVKDSESNEELRYSLRSVEQNFPHRNVWFMGGKPKGLEPDRWAPVEQNQSTKWGNTSMLLRAACENLEISDDFVLFNDDFFVLKHIKALPYYSDGSISARVIKLYAKYHIDSTYGDKLRSTQRLLESNGYSAISFATHYPIIINKAEMLETFERFPTGLMWRSIYGNHHKKLPTLVFDCKINDLKTVPNDTQHYVSTKDTTFNYGAVGEWLRQKFSEKCKYETD